MAHSRTGLAIALTGLGLGIVGAVFIARHRARGSLGRYVTEPASPPPLVGERHAGGMKVRHYRAPRITIEQRVRLIQDKVMEGVQDGRMRKLALQITKNCPERDGMCEAKAVYSYLKKHLRYTGDVAPIAMGAGGPVEAIDFFQSAPRSLEFGGGDCDDHVIAGAVLMALNGLPVRLRVTAESMLGEHGHIYPVVGLPKLSPTKWWAADTTLPGHKFGVEVPFARNLDFKTVDVPA